MEERKIQEEILEAYRMDLIANEKGKRTIEKYMRDLRFFQTFAAERPMDKMLTLAYKNVLEKQYAISSANSMLAALNSFCRFMGWHDCCVKQFRVQKRAYCAEEKELSKEEYYALVRAAESKNNQRLALLIQTICGTGIRVSEIEFITVEAVKRGEAVVSCKGKTRTIFIVSALRKKLLRYAKSHRIYTGMIFVTKYGMPMNRSNIWLEMKRLCKITGIHPDKVFPHNLRHLFARTFYKIEKDIAQLADILGHSNINTTRIYTISTGAEHRRKMEHMRLII